MQRKQCAHALRDAAEPLKKLALVALTAITIVAALFVVQVPGCVRSIAGKSGRVIDHDTGEGLANVPVVVEGFITQNNWATEDKRCTFLEMTKTDAGGYFQLPNHFGLFDVGVPWSSPEHYWTIAVGENGYVPAKTKLPLEWDNDGSLNSSIPRFNTSKNVSWQGMAEAIPTIELMQLSTTFDQEVEMFSRRSLDQFKQCDAVESQDLNAMKTATSEFYRHAENYACAVPAAWADARTARSLYWLASEPDKFRESLELAAPNFLRGGRERKSRIRLANLCAAMRAGDDVKR